MTQLQGPPRRRTIPLPTAWTERYVAAQNTHEFQDLRARQRRFAFPMTFVFLVWFLLLIVAAGWAKDFMSTTLAGSVNVAYLFALLQFVSTFAIAYAYKHYAERHLDPAADHLRAEIERGVLEEDRP